MSLGQDNWRSRMLKIESRGNNFYYLPAHLHILTVCEGVGNLMIMAMASLNISLPQSLKDYIENQVSAGGYSTPSEYLRELLRQDQKQRTEDRLEALLLDGLNSGAPIEITPEYWETKRRQLVDRHAKKTGTR